MAYQIQRQLSRHDYVLQQSLNPDHELLRLAAKIDWDAIAERLRPYYRIRGRGVAGRSRQLV